jgi:putative phosphoribosyl transferase
MGGVFRDRDEAGRRLGELVREHVGPPAVVLGVPRGGVIVAKHVAAALDAPLDVVVPRKLGAPGNPELGIGAVAPDIVVLNEDLVRRLGVSRDYVEREAGRQQAEVERRTRAYRGDRTAPDLAGRTAVIVDDGVATGGTVLASIGWARAQGPSRVVLAVPVLPSSMLPKLRSTADDVVSLAAPHLFGSVGEWYDQFPQVDDREVRAALEVVG